LLYAFAYSESGIMTNTNKDKEIVETFESFFNQFGKMDSHTKIVLEEFFKKLLNESKK